MTTATPTKPPPALGAEKQEAHPVTMVPIGDVIVTPDNPRKVKDDAAMRELVASVLARGIIQPPVGRPHPTRPGKIDLRCGARRLAAAHRAGMERIPVIVRDLTDVEAKAITACENMERADLTPLEAAASVQLLLAEGLDHAEAADQLGKTSQWVARRASLLRLTAKWRERIADARAHYSTWSAAMLGQVARLPTVTQDAVLKDLMRHPRGKPTLDELKRVIARHVGGMKSAPWKLDDELLDPKAGACCTCKKRASLQLELFESDEVQPDNPKGDTCLDHACYRRKLVAHIRAREAELKAKHGKVLFAHGDNCHNGKNDVSETVGRTVQSFWETTFVKRGTPGAVPTLLASGADAGRLRWTKPRGSAGTSSGGNGSRAKGTPTPLAERRAKLQRRRDAQVIMDVRAELEKLTVEDVKGFDYDLPALLLAFGASGVGSWWHEYDERRDADQAGNVANVFLMVVEVWIDMLYPSAGSQPSTLSTQIYSAQRICEVLGWDFDVFAQEAAEALPESKSWANLNEDGTPKKAKSTKTEAK